MELKKSADKKKMKYLLFILSILYVILPVDLIPDFTPIIGHLDDFVLVLVSISNLLNVLKKKDVMSGDVVGNSGNNKKQKKDVVIDGEIEE